MERQAVWHGIADCHPAIDRMRLSSGRDTHYNGAVIVKTDFDSDSSRPWVYVGIAPKPERCKMAYSY